jgi:hypothetical protein
VAREGAFVYMPSWRGKVESRTRLSDESDAGAETDCSTGVKVVVRPRRESYCRCYLCRGEREPQINRRFAPGSSHARWAMAPSSSHDEGHQWEMVV